MNKNAFVNLCPSTDFKILAAGRHIRSFFKNHYINGLHLAFNNASYLKILTVV